MFDPFNKQKKYLTWTFVLIIFLIISGVGWGKDYHKIIPIDPKDVDGQFCFIKVTIKQVGDEIVKEEILECADGKRQFDGPTYWEMFAQFYYAGVNVPEYCRQYSRPKHALKSFGEVCLSTTGKWEVK
jgi:hypothetical protein